MPNPGEAETKLDPNENQEPMDAKDPNEGQEKSPASVVMTMQSALTQMGQGLSGKIPPQAQKALEAAISAYNQFVSIVGSKLGVQGMQAPQAPQGPQNAATAGRANAVPAGQPMRPGAQPAGY